MIPETSFPQAIPPYRRPVPVVDQDPDTDDQVQVCFNPLWTGYIIGCLKSLLLQATWDTDDPAVLDLVQQRTFTLINLFATATDGCGLTVPGVLCISGTFADIDYGFISNPAADCVSLWLAGVGWKSCVNADDTSELWFRRDMNPVGTEITSYQFHLFTGIGNGFHITVSWYLGGMLQRADTLNVAAGGGDTISSSTPVQADAVTIDAVLNNAGSHAVIACDDWKMCFIGAFPLSNSLSGTFTHTFDFTLNDGGFVPIVSGGDGLDRAVYTPGVGWQSLAVPHSSPTEEDCRFTRSLAISTRFTRVQAVYTNSLALNEADTLNFAASMTPRNAGTDAVCDTGPINLFATVIRNDFYTATIAGGQFTISKMIFSGVGSDPF
jgi:hypothetical protein